MLDAVDDATDNASRHLARREAERRDGSPAASSVGASLAHPRSAFRIATRGQSANRQAPADGDACSSAERMRMELVRSLKPDYLPTSCIPWRSRSSLASRRVPSRTVTGFTTTTGWWSSSTPRPAVSTACPASPTTPGKHWRTAPERFERRYSRRSPPMLSAVSRTRRRGAVAFVLVRLPAHASVKGLKRYNAARDAQDRETPIKVFCEVTDVDNG